MAQGLIVRLGDGSEIGPLGRDDLRSWFERGLISAESLVKRPDGARWTTLGQEIDVTLWRQLAGTGARSGGSASSATRSGTAPGRSAAPTGRAGGGGTRAGGTGVYGRARVDESAGGLAAAWSSFELPGWARWAALAVVALAALAGGYVYFTAETPAQKALRASAAPERRFEDPDAGVALDIPDGWIIVRPGTDAVAAPPSARVLVAEPSALTVGYISSESPERPYATLDAFLDRLVQDRQKTQASYEVQARGDASAGPFAARVASASWKAGEDGFSERIAVWKEAWTYFGLVTWTPQRREGRGGRATEALLRSFSSVGQVGQRVQQALQRVIADVPHLSARAAETLMGRSAAGVLEPPEVFRRSWDLGSRGLGALNRTESRELSNLIAAVYARVSGRDRSRLAAYVARVRARESTPVAEDQEMCALMKSAVDKLPALQRERLQILFDKALAAGIGRP
jgi:hypothetical protein